MWGILLSVYMSIAPCFHILVVTLLWFVLLTWKVSMHWFWFVFKCENGVFAGFLSSVVWWCTLRSSYIYKVMRNFNMSRDTEFLAVCQQGTEGRAIFKRHCSLYSEVTFDLFHRITLLKGLVFCPQHNIPEGQKKVPNKESVQLDLV